MAVSRSGYNAGHWLQFWALVGIFSAGTLIGSVQAFDAVWTGQASTGPNGIFSDPANWSGPGLPASGDNALFSLPAEYSVQFSSSPMLHDTVVSNGSVTFTLANGSNQLYTMTNDWRQVSGSSTIDGLDLEIYKAIRVHGESALAVQGNSAISVLGGMLIGTATAGDASMRVTGTNGATLQVSGSTKIGDFNGGSSSMRIEEGAIAHFDSLISVGAGGSGVLEVLSGSQVELDGTLLIAGAAGSGSGKLTIAGNSTFFDVVGGGEVVVGANTRSAQLHVIDGATFSTGTEMTELHATSSLLVDGGKIEVQGLLKGLGHISLQNQGITTVGGVANIDGVTTIASASQFTTAGLMNVSTAEGRVGQISVSGAGSLLSVGSILDFQRSATLDVHSGGAVTAGTIQFASSGGKVEVDVVGQGAKIAAGKVVVGGRANGTGYTQGGTSEVAIGTGGILEYTNELKILAGSSVRLEGGELRAPNFVALSDAGFVFDAGTYTVMGNATINSSVVSNLPGGTLQFGRGIEVVGKATINAPLTIAGGHLGVAELAGGNLIDFQHGSLKFTGASGLAISSSGPLGETLNLASGSALEVATDLSVTDEALLVVQGGKVAATNFYNAGQLQLDGATSEIHASSLTNTGLIVGEGRLVGGPLQNLLGGTVAVANDRQLRLAGSGNRNAGRIELAAGRLQVDGDLLNLPGGDIVGRGTFTLAEGLVNEGDFLLTGGVSDIFGKVTNQESGRVMISGDAQVVFWDDVVHTGGAFHVAGNSSVTFFGTAGFSVTGDSGKVYFEGNVAPGNSPGLGEFGGDVHFGAASELQIELAGTAKGLEYDSLAADGTAYLGGNLMVSLLDDYLPVAGDLFEIVTAESIVGTFSSVSLPDIGSSLFLETIYDAQSVSLLVVSPIVVLEGDYNGDGRVDGADYTVWRNSLGSSGEGLAADGDLSGMVDANDYVVWKSNFGKGLPTTVHSAAAVPEPSAIGLALSLATLLVTAGRSASRRAGA